MERISEADIISEIIESLGLGAPPENSFTVTMMYDRLKEAGNAYPTRRALYSKLETQVEKGLLLKGSYISGRKRRPENYYWKRPK